MYKWFTTALALITGGAIYYSQQDLTGIIAAAVAAIVIAHVPTVFYLARKTYQTSNILPIAIGIFMGLVEAGLTAPYLKTFPPYVVWGLIGLLMAANAVVMYKYQLEVGFSFAGGAVPETEPEYTGTVPKILDTSIVIDGRIIDIAGTGFIEGPFVVPNFVLREIQLISDSPDPIKRNRGRRGLDMLNQLRKREDLEVRISYKDYSDTREVDAKLIRLSREMGGKLVTNDFNLNKVAQLQGLEVLNINNLANAIKPVVLPGEEMDIQVVKEGKDENQGIGYLDDGTMVVIENGGKLLNKRVKVAVTSVIQTNAGKMVFTKLASKS